LSVERDLAFAMRTFIYTAETMLVTATEAPGVQRMPAGRSTGEKPKVADRRYLRPDEAFSRDQAFVAFAESCIEFDQMRHRRP
jgi:hypothetical protein